MSERAKELLKELQKKDYSREELLEHLASAENMLELEQANYARSVARWERRRLAFPACCQAPLGFEGHLAPQQLSAVVSRAQTSFFACRLAVDPECAPFFDIAEIKSGNRSHFVNAQQIAASLFPPLPTKSQTGFLEMREAHKLLMWPSEYELMPGQDMTIYVVNRSDAPKTFRAAVWGSMRE
jgi:hypothetical protein